MWNQPKTTEGMVDPRVVVNRRQAEALLTAVSYQGRVGPRLVAFFACLYYAGLRPSEAVELREDLNLDLPNGDGWGTLYLHSSAPLSEPVGHAVAAAATPANSNTEPAAPSALFPATPRLPATCTGI